MSNASQEVASQNQFRDTILKEVGEIPLSDTQKYRVLLVLDEDTKQPRISAQRWWRKSKLDEWVAGKGFKFVSKEEATKFAMLILSGVDMLVDIDEGLTIN